MFFLSNNIIGAEKYSVPLTPTSINRMNYILLQYGLYDCLYITNETSSGLRDDCPENWDKDTIFHAEYGNNPNAGNVDWNLETVSDIIIKRRDVEQFKWITIAVKKIERLEDFNTGLRGNDHLNAANRKYEYALFPVFEKVEGRPISTFVNSKFNKIFVTEKNKIMGTEATDGFCDTSRITPSSTVETIKNKYPTYIRNTVANYDKGSVNGKWYEMDETCEVITENKKRVPYQKGFMDFITNGMPKLLKHFDGRIWLISVTGDPTDTAEGTYDNRAISFEFTEIGHYESEKDLYYTNLSDIEEEWWNT